MLKVLVGVFAGIGSLLAALFGVVAVIQLANNGWSGFAAPFFTTWAVVFAVTAGLALLAGRWLEGRSSR